MAEFRKVDLCDVVALAVNDYVKLRIRVNGLYYFLVARVDFADGSNFWDFDIPVNVITNRVMNNYDYDIHHQINSILDSECSSWYVQRGYAG